ncbi:hypothetical protein [Methylobacterium sp.]|uniref:hypothetical protein n=1 Tax=Methylobacterium sp. TaxID=409 RepID=UPI003B013EDB
MDEQVLAMLGSLVEIRTELGEAVYQGALDRARLAIASEVMVEAERVALRRARLHPEGNVVRLPMRDGPRRTSTQKGSDGTA